MGEDLLSSTLHIRCSFSRMDGFRLNVFGANILGFRFEALLFRLLVDLNAAAWKVEAVVS
jgi:hypothetical protein